MSQAPLSVRAPASFRIMVLFWTGCVSVVVQILSLRECMGVFEGNEVSIGVVLTAWLLWTALGSAGAGRWISGELPRARRLFSVALVIAGLACPLTFGAIRLLPRILGQIRGETLGPDGLLFAFLLLAPFCVSSGALFPAAISAVVGQPSQPDSGLTWQSNLGPRIDVPGQVVGRVYLLEAVGSAVGGLACAFLLAWVSPFQVAGAICLVNLLLAFLLIWWRPRLAFGLLVSGSALLAVAQPGEWVERKTSELLWQGYKLVATRNSPYGSLALVQAGGEPVIFQNGIVLFGAIDEQTAEETVHLPLLQHPSPRRVLLIGGGSPSVLTHALEHPSLEVLDYVEADPTLLQLFEEAFPRDWNRLRADRRVHVHQADARRLVRSGNSTYDVIIVSLPPPRTIQLNRYYTEEFFREAGARLAKGGLLAVLLPGSEDYISLDLARFLACIRKTLGRAFPAFAAIPGDPVYLFASHDPQSLTLDPSVLVARLKDRRLPSLYVREYYLPFRLMPDRVRELDRVTKPGPEVSVNQDFSPRAYYADFVLWGARFGAGYRDFFRRLAEIPYGAVLAVCAGLGFLGLVTVSRPGSRSRLPAAVSICVGIVGLTMMGLQILMLLGFQALYGFVYQHLALLVGAFMVGLALGSRFGLGRKPTPRLIVFLQVFVGLWPLVLYATFLVLAGGNSLVLPYAVFPGLALTTGWLGGFHFAASCGVYFSGGGGANLGTLYAVDLAGAAAGAILLSGYLLPVFGFMRTACLLVFLNSLGAAVLVVAAGRRLRTEEVSD